MAAITLSRLSFVLVGTSNSEERGFVEAAHWNGGEDSLVEIALPLS